MESPSPILETAIRIGTQEFPLRSRAASILHLLAMHQQQINSMASLKVIFDCGAAGVSLTIQTKVGQRKNPR
jgi:hypothetical protein